MKIYKRIPIISVFILFNIVLFAQVEESESMLIKKICPKTYQVIVGKAELEWPNDYEMQKYVIEKQCSAFSEYIDLDKEYPSIPSDIYRKIREMAIIQWGKRSLDDCVDLVNYDGDLMYSCVGADWEMVVYTIKKQCDAYIDLHN